MLETRDLGNHEEARRMKVGGLNIMNQPASQRAVQSTFVGEWRQDLQVVAVRGGTHEHGEWEAIGGGQTKVFRLVGIKGLGI